MKKSTILKRHIVCALTICLFAFVLFFFDVTCPILYLFHLPCPTCGVSRALVAFFTFKFNDYFHYQPFAIPLIICVMLTVHSKFFKHKIAVFSFIILVLIMNLIFYFLRFTEIPYL